MSTMENDGERAGRVFTRHAPARSGAQCYRSESGAQMAAPFHHLTPERVRATESSSGHGFGNGVSGMREQLSSINERINMVDAEAKRLAKDETSRLGQIRSRLSQPKSEQEPESGSGSRGRQSAPSDRRRAQSLSTTWGRRARQPTPQSWPRRSIPSRRPLRRSDLRSSDGPITVWCQSSLKMLKTTLIHRTDLRHTLSERGSCAHMCVCAPPRAAAERKSAI